MSRISRWFVVGLIMAVMFFSLACSLSSLTGTPATATPEPTSDLPTYSPPTAKAPTPGKATNEPTKAGAATAKPTAAGGATTAPGAAPQIADASAGLDKVDSYRMVFNMVVDGKDASGKAARQDMKLIQEYIKSKDSMRMSVKGSGWDTGNSDMGAFDVYQIGKTGYIMTTPKDGSKPTCMSFSSDQPTFDKSQLVSPDDLMRSIQGRDLVAKGETVNGVKADHYKLSKADLGFGTTTSQSGEVWIAQEGGYMVRFTGQAEGEFSLSADKVMGKVTWTYDLQDINKLTAITPPAECTASSDATKDLPIPSNFSFR